MNHKSEQSKTIATPTVKLKDLQTQQILEVNDNTINRWVQANIKNSLYLQQGTALSLPVEYVPDHQQKLETLDVGDRIFVEDECCEQVVKAEENRHFRESCDAVGFSYNETGEYVTRAWWMYEVIEGGAR